MPRPTTHAQQLTAALAASQVEARRVAASEARVSRRERFAPGDRVVSDTQGGKLLHGTVEHLAGRAGPNQQIVVRFDRSGLVGTPELAERWRHATVRRVGPVPVPLNNPSAVALAARTSTIPAMPSPTVAARRSVPRPDLRSWLGQVVDVTVDRPAGTMHPDGWFRYPVNYGHIADTISGDGEPIDVYILGITVPVGRCGGVVSAVIERADDDEDKLVVCLAGEWDAQRIAAAVAFTEAHFESAVITRDTAADQ